MSITGFMITVGVVIAMILVYKYADQWVKKMDPGTVKTLNWIGFIVGVAGGVLWYATANGIFMFITLAGVLFYFLFYGYDSMEEKEKRGNP
ncbi:MAG: hypothetical protein HS130_10405 [Deltaproteobacteria bacterium]|nr:hypothetical protein [Deltaproteobacteria bacterium]MCL4873722.1 hypothetical protein [bacterium]